MIAGIHTNLNLLRAAQSTSAYTNLNPKVISIVYVFHVFHFSVNQLVNREINGINRLSIVFSVYLITHCINPLSNQIHRLFFTWYINGITRLMDGWGARPRPWGRHPPRSNAMN